MQFDRGTEMPNTKQNGITLIDILKEQTGLGSLATHKAHSEDSDQTGRMPRLI